MWRAAERLAILYFIGPAPGGGMVSHAKFAPPVDSCGDMPTGLLANDR